VNLDKTTAYAFVESLTVHIHYVREAGRRLGVPEQQLAVHDQSKYSDAEFAAYAQHFHGGGAPTEFCCGWLHHIHHNPHHWQHWMFPDGFTMRGADWTMEPGGLLYMPEHYALEMVADWYGASKAYTDSWDMTDWLRKNVGRILLHSRTADFVKGVLIDEGYLSVFQETDFNRERKAAI
jgi:uncharacterized protein DUF5662